jgi:long-chain acyl-CoA synthetase
MEWGAKAAFATGIDKLPEELRIAQPTLIVAVPRVFEKVYNSATHTAEQSGKGAIFNRAADTAIAWSRNRSAGSHSMFSPGPFLVTAQHALFAPLVYKKLQGAFGGRMRLAFSGGGPLGERLTHFFNGVGVRVLEGYGLTETSPVLTLNRPDAWRPGTVGQPVAATTIRIADDGEILAKGPQVFGGYWHAEAATAEVFDGDGWFHTGDIGEVDGDGFLRITGRKKEIIVTAAGKNVAPGPLEDRIRAHPLVSQAMVVGDGRPFIGAVVTLDEEAVDQWVADKGMAATGREDLTELAPLRQALQEAIDGANASVSRAESIRAFAILPRDLSIEAGELTPTLKVRRAVVERTYADVIDKLYVARPAEPQAKK